MPIGSKNASIPGCGMHHIAVHTRDWEASLKLYRDVLGMEIAVEFGSTERKIILLDMGDGSHMELFQPTPEGAKLGDPAPNDPVDHFALATSDARAAIEHVRRAGYEITMEPRDLELGSLRVTIAFFAGPNGESVEFVQTH